MAQGGELILIYLLKMLLSNQPDLLDLSQGPALSLCLMVALQGLYGFQHNRIIWHKHLAPLVHDGVRAVSLLSHHGSEVLQEYAATRGLTDTSALFPSPAEDPILKSLLGLPWQENKSEAALKGLPAFKRAMELPEYHPSFVKIAGAHTAFYRGAKILNTQDSIDGNPHGGIFVEIPDMVLYGSADPSKSLRFSEIEKLINENGTVAFEADTLIKHPTLDHLTLYQKGVGVIPRGPDLFEVCELTVKHPGLRLTGAGFTTGWI